MRRIVPLGLLVALLFVTVAVSSPTDANAQGAGLISSLLNRMERNQQSLKSLRASVYMEKFNSQTQDKDTYRGVVLYVPAAGRNAYVRVDWSEPRVETLTVANGQFKLFRPRLNLVYFGNSNSSKNKVGGAFEFLNMSRQQLASRYDVQYMGEETLYGGVATTHVKLLPKGGASFKWAEAWIDAGGMPVQTKVIEKNDDSTSVRLTDLQRNANISLDQFDLKLASSVKRIPA
jgi:outer membrane lipoprotein-sorting protein